MRKCIPPKKGVNVENLRLYRSLVENCRKLEDNVLSCRSVSELFNDPKNELKRIREQSETLLLHDPIEYGRKSEELVWRRSYHDYMKCYKRFKKVASPEEVGLLVTHFISGTGLYDSLIKKIAIEYGLELSGVLPEITKWDLYIEDEVEEKINETVHTADEIGCVKQCIHRIFVYLGDIFRYLSEIGYYNSNMQAIRWYNTAISYDPTIGMPFNQLGTLSEMNNYGLNATYYYMRCLTSEKPFDGAGSNLSRILISSSKFLNESGDEDLMKKCVGKFLKVTREFWLASDNLLDDNLGASITVSLDLLKGALKIPAKMSIPQKPTYLDSGMIYKMGVIGLMLVDNLQSKNNEYELAIVAFILNFLYLLIEQIGASLKLKLESKDEENKNTNIPPVNSRFTLLSNSQSTSKENTPDLSPRRALSRLRRRKAAINFNDGSTNLLDLDDDDSELSELEETALSTIDALDISSDISESGSMCDGNDELGNNLNSSDEEIRHPGSSQNSITISLSTSDIDGLLHYIYYETSLPTIKVYCDWLRINHKMMEYCVDSFKGLFRQLSILLNYLIEIEKVALAKYPSLMEFKYTDLNWKQKHPMTVDFAIYKFRMLNGFHSKFIDFDLRRSLNSSELGFLCSQSFISFGHFVVNNINKSGISYNSEFNSFNFDEGWNNANQYDLDPIQEEQVMFKNGNGFSAFEETVIKSPEDNYNGQKETFNSMEPEDYFKKKEVMRNMAHLWLKSEVNKLEKQVNKKGKLPQLPPYLIVDSSAYLNNLNLIKDLVYSKRFIVVVPKIVLSDLDQKKKMSVIAREAIRWLESEAIKGTRFVKFLRENERSSLAPIKYPRRKDKESFEFFALLENCNYLNQQVNSGQKDMGMVTLLYSPSNSFPINYQALLGNVEIQAEHIEVFVSKWKNSMKAKT